MEINRYNDTFVQEFKKYRIPSGKNAKTTGEKVFFSYIEKTKSCWLWLGKKASNGYGMFVYKGKYHLAHRLSYVLHRKEKILKKLVCHTCDVRNCVNPSHLFLGDAKDNMRDCMTKKRHNPPRGPKSGKTKFTLDDVIKMFEMRNSGFFFKEIAQKFKTYPNTVGRIVNGERWAHYTENLRKERTR